MGTLWACWEHSWSPAPADSPTPGATPALGEAGGGLSAAVAAAQRGPGLRALHTPSPRQPCTWQPPTSCISSLAIPRPPSLRPPHRKLFLINENGKLGPHVTSRDVLGSRSNGSHPGSEWPGLGRVLLFPTRAWRCAKGTQAPGDPSGRCTGSAPPAPRPPTLGS